VLDFYCPNRKLAIEVDGDSHYLDEGPLRDEGREVVLAREGIRVLRFTNNQVKEELEGVLETIIAELETPLSEPRCRPREPAPTG
jgi:very-short-patch-repair endonuclease